MSKVLQRREFFRLQIKKQAISKMKKQIRDIMLLHSSTKNQSCFVCGNQSIIEAKRQTIITVLQGAFHHSIICTGHIELVFSRILEIIFQYPHYFTFFIDQALQSTFFIRKVILLTQIIENDMLLDNTSLQDEISRAFQQKNGFVIKLLNYTYQYEQCEEGSIQNKRFFAMVCRRTVKHILSKFPLLMQSLCQKYPLFELVRLNEGQSSGQFYTIFASIATQAVQRYDIFSSLMKSVEEALIILLKTSNSQKKEQENQLFELIRFIMNTKLPLTMQFYSDLIANLRNKVSSSHTRPVLEMILFRYQEYLKIDQQQHIQEGLEMLLEEINDKDLKMDVENC